MTKGTRTMGTEKDTTGTTMGPLEAGQRWSVARKREVVLRMLRGDSLDALSRELGVEIARLERWKARALEAMEAGLRERGGDPVEHELTLAKARIGELSMENELLRAKVGKSGPFATKRSRR